MKWYLTKMLQFVITAIVFSTFMLISNTVYAQTEFKLLPRLEDRAVGDQFGVSVSISGELIIVGAEMDDDFGLNSGSVYIFKRNGIGWIEEANLNSSNASTPHQFGASVSISGNMVIVGAPLDVINNARTGLAYIFSRNNGGEWGEVKRLNGGDSAQSDRFGRAVSIDGDYAVVGAPLDDNPGTNAGSAYIFFRNQPVMDNWGRVAKLDPNGLDAQDQFGFAVSINGDRVIIGAPFDDDGGADAGAVYIFKRNGTTWLREAKLTAGDAPTIGDLFGNSVSISGDRVIIGAPGDDSVAAGTSASGSAYVFKRDGTNWSQEGAKLTATDPVTNDVFGYSVAISGNLVIVGSYADDNTKGVNAGSAYIFKRTGSSWNREEHLIASTTKANDFLGWSVATMGNQAVAGAINHAAELGISSGSAHVFTLESATQPLVASAGSDKAICRGQSVTIGGSPTATGGVAPITYSWVPTASLNNATSDNPIATPTATTNYTVTVTDSIGSTATDQVRVTVNPLPQANAGADKEIAIGQSVTIGGNPTATGGTGQLTIRWSPATGLDSSEVANPTASPAVTTSYTVEVTDANGCTATDLVRVNVTGPAPRELVVFIPDIQADPNSNTQVLVNIKGDDVTKIFAGSVSFDYDTSVINSPVVVAGELLGSIVSFKDTSGQISFAFASTIPLGGAGTLAKVTFDVVGSPGTSTLLDLTKGTFNEEALTAVLDDGILEVRSNVVISGNVAYYSDESKVMDGVMLDIMNGVADTTMTAGDGNYSFEVPFGSSFTLTPEFLVNETQIQQAISALDATPILQFAAEFPPASIFGGELEGGRFLAADVTGNGSVSAADATPILQFEAYTPEEQRFPSQLGAVVFSPSVRQFTNVISDQNGQDFAAIIRGDVTGNFNPDNTSQLAAGSLPRGSSNPMVAKSANGDINRIALKGARIEEAAKILRVPVWVETTDGLLAMTIGISYEGASLEYAGLEKEARMEGFQVVVNDFVSDRIVIALAGSQPAEDGKTMEILFKMKRPATNEILANYIQVNKAEINEIAEVEVIVDLFPTLTAVEGVQTIPEQFVLMQNYPNPFNPETEIRFKLPKASHVVLRIFNAIGQEIRMLVDGEFGVGVQSITWDARDNAGNPVPSGVYIYKIQAGDFSQVKKMSLMR